MSFVLVVLQISLSVAILWIHGLVWPRPLGMILATIGILLGLWGIVAMKPANVSILPDVRKNSCLVITGPYRFIRHPMYTGLLMLCLGAVVSRPSILLFVLWICLVITLLAKSRYEESLLTRSFSDYAAYKSKTWRFIPYIL
jgi:protein-S-isoprenylcysteine O-methyltransferase Ste14